MKRQRVTRSTKKKKRRPTCPNVERSDRFDGPNQFGPDLFTTVSFSSLFDIREMEKNSIDPKDSVVLLYAADGRRNGIYIPVGPSFENVISSSQQLGLRHWDGIQSRFMFPLIQDVCVPVGRCAARHYDISGSVPARQVGARINGSLSPFTPSVDVSTFFLTFKCVATTLVLHHVPPTNGIFRLQTM